MTFPFDEPVKVLNQLSLPFDATDADACDEARRQLGLDASVEAYVFRRSLDARHKNALRKIFSVALVTDLNDARLSDFVPYRFSPDRVTGRERPHIIGMGPAGLFCAYLCALHGLKPILIDRGKPVEERTRDVARFRAGGALDEESNVPFGEGGAGTFSDGKLVTRINDPRTREVLRLFVECGADEDILREAKPHLGTDKLCTVVRNLRQKIVELGGEVRFSTHLDRVEITDGRVSGVVLNGVREDAHTVVLATGNGARDTYDMVLSSTIFTEAKPFSVGFRMEHLQAEINRARYGSFADRLPAADYAFSAHYGTDAAYTFCMCPGGEVINASSTRGGLVTNGMSESARAGTNANAALLCGVSFATPREGLDFQQRLETTAFRMGNGAVPVILQKDFLSGTRSTAFGRIRPTVTPGTVFADFADLFPPRVLAVLRRGVGDFSKQILHSDDAVFSAPETRTSAPLRMVRDPESLQSRTVRGLYPCGEGAGYAGGITSSAADGLRVAEKIITAISAAEA